MFQLIALLFPDWPFYILLYSLFMFSYIDVIQITDYSLILFIHLIWESATQNTFIKHRPSLYVVVYWYDVTLQIWLTDTCLSCDSLHAILPKWQLPVWPIQLVSPGIHERGRVGENGFRGLMTQGKRGLQERVGLQALAIPSSLCHLYYY